MFLDKFILPDSDDEYSIGFKKRQENGGYLDNGYPCSLFTSKKLYELDFEKVTIIYGGNGSGKSTLLNIIANKLKLNRVSPFNNSELFSLYVDVCKYKLGFDDEGKVNSIPKNSRIITSDDIFDYMLAIRTNNEEISENIQEGKSDYSALKYGENIKISGLENYDQFRMQVLTRKKSLTRRKFIRQFAGQEVKLNSNGETSIDYFKNQMQNDTLFCLDEPENSLSPKMHLKLKELIEIKSRYCGCQFIIATHSPFILSVKGAKIYDLDETPVNIKKWWEVENAKIYFDFFNSHKDLFVK